MFTVRVVALTSVVVAVANAVVAQEFSGAEIALEYRDNLTQDDSQMALDASAALSFGSGFGMQFGIKNADYSPFDAWATGYELHGTYAASDALALGVFAGQEFFGTGSSNAYTYMGIETAYSTGPISIEAALSRYEGDLYQATNLALDGAYSINDRVDFLAGYHGNDTTNKVKYAYVGASYMVADGLDLSAKFGNEDDNGSNSNIVSLGVSYSLGDGVIFRQRSYTELFPTN
jgi:hypothetical protein